MSPMKKLLCTLVLATVGTFVAKADSISIVFDKPSQVATPGSTLIFTGTITNLTSGTVFLNGDYFTLTGTGFTINDQFFNTVPFTLSAGANSGSIELFDVNVPVSPAAITQSGSYGLTGGSDGNAINNLGSSTFTLTPAVPVGVPEIDPSVASSGLVLLIGGIAVFRGRRVRQAVSAS